MISSLQKDSVEIVEKKALMFVLTRGHALRVLSDQSRQLAQKFKVARINHPNLQKMEPARLLESDRMDDRQQLSARRKKKTENKNKIIYRFKATGMTRFPISCRIVGI